MRWCIMIEVVIFYQFLSCRVIHELHHVHFVTSHDWSAIFQFCCFCLNSAIDRAILGSDHVGLLLPHCIQGQWRMTERLLFAVPGARSCWFWPSMLLKTKTEKPRCALCTKHKKLWITLFSQLVTMLVNFAIVSHRLVMMHQNLYHDN